LNVGIQEGIVKRQTLSTPDLALLRLDSADNLMIVTAVMILDMPLQLDDLKAAIERALLRFDRFKERVIFSPLPWQKPYWEEDPAFDLDAHVVRLQTPVSAEHKLLEDLIGKLMSIGLDPNRPLWQFFLLEHFGEGSVIVARFHHSLADGMALLCLMLTMTDISADGSLDNQELSAAAVSESIAEARPRRATSRRLAQAVIRAASDWPYALEQIRLGRDVATAMGKLLLTAPDPYPFFRGRLGIQKRAAWSEPISLKEIKFVGKAMGGTVNDVIINTLSGALRGYLELRCGTVDRATIHGIVPVNLREKGRETELGNKFGAVLIELPIGVCDPLERMRYLRKQTANLKSSREALAYYAMLSIMGGLPNRIQQTAVNILDTKGTAIITNIAGPQGQLYMAGAPINTIMAWVPQSGRIGLGLSVISYNGMVQIGVACDADLVPDPQQIIDCFIQEFDTLKELAHEREDRDNKPIQEMLNRLDQALLSVDKILSEQGNLAVSEGTGITLEGD
jgi:diacylglycerol O-acyltransferase